MGNTLAPPASREELVGLVERLRAPKVAAAAATAAQSGVFEQRQVVSCVKACGGGGRLACMLPLLSGTDLPEGVTVEDARRVAVAVAAAVTDDTQRSAFLLSGGMGNVAKLMDKVAPAVAGGAPALLGPQEARALLLATVQAMDNDPVVARQQWHGVDGLRHLMSLARRCLASAEAEPAGGGVVAHTSAFQDGPSLVPTLALMVAGNLTEFCHPSPELLSSTIKAVRRALADGLVPLTLEVLERWPASYDAMSVAGVLLLNLCEGESQDVSGSGDGSSDGGGASGHRDTEDDEDEKGGTLWSGVSDILHTPRVATALLQCLRHAAADVPPSRPPADMDKEDAVKMQRALYQRSMGLHRVVKMLEAFISRESVLEAFNGPAADDNVRSFITVLRHATHWRRPLLSALQLLCDLVQEDSLAEPAGAMAWRVVSHMIAVDGEAGAGGGGAGPASASASGLSILAAGLQQAITSTPDMSEYMEEEVACQVAKGVVVDLVLMCDVVVNRGWAAQHAFAAALAASAVLPALAGALAHFKYEPSLVKMALQLLSALVCMYGPSQHPASQAVLTVMAARGGVVEGAVAAFDDNIRAMIRFHVRAAPNGDVVWASSTQSRRGKPGRVEGQAVTDAYISMPASAHGQAAAGALEFLARATAFPDLRDAFLRVPAALSTICGRSMDTLESQAQFRLAMRIVHNTSAPMAAGNALPASDVDAAKGPAGALARGSLPLHLGMLLGCMQPIVAAQVQLAHVRRASAVTATFPAMSAQLSAAESSHRKKPWPAPTQHECDQAVLALEQVAHACAALAEMTAAVPEAGDAWWEVQSLPLGSAGEGISFRDSLPRVLKALEALTTFVAPRDGETGPLRGIALDTRASAVGHAALLAASVKGTRDPTVAAQLDAMCDPIADGLTSAVYAWAEEAGPHFARSAMLAYGATAEALDAITTPMGASGSAGGPVPARYLSVRGRDHDQADRVDGPVLGQLECAGELSLMAMATLVRDGGPRMKTALTAAWQRRGLSVVLTAAVQAYLARWRGDIAGTTACASAAVAACAASSGGAGGETRVSDAVELDVGRAALAVRLAAGVLRIMR